MANYTTPRYAAFIDLTNQLVVIIGGGPVAERKVETLLDYGANVRLVAPEVTPAIQKAADEGKITLIRRSYEYGDLSGARLAICAAGLKDVDDIAHQEAAEVNCLINVCDVPDLCDFIVPAMVKRGPLQIAISTSGAAPTVAKQIKHELMERYDSNWENYISFLGEMRGLVMARIEGGEPVRKPLFEALSESDLFERICAGEQLDAEEAYEHYITPLIVGA